MVQELTQTLNRLRVQETNSKKDGYVRDATDFAFRRHTLTLLKQLTKVRFKPVNLDTLFKQNKVLRKRVEKLEFDLDYYIKNYPDAEAQVKESK